MRSLNKAMKGEGELMKDKEVLSGCQHEGVISTFLQTFPT